MKFNLCTVVVVVAVISSCTTICYSARILGFFPSMSKSHLIVHLSVVRPLVQRGHNVTVVTTLPLGQPNPGFRHIKLPSTDLDQEMLKGMTQTPQAGFMPSHMFGFMKFILQSSDQVLREPQMQKLMKEETFDLVIFGYFMNDFQLGIAAHFKCPVVVSWMSQSMTFTDEMIGNTIDLAYVSHFLFGSNQPMNYWDRVINTFGGVFDFVFGHLLRYFMKSYYVSHFPPEKYPSYDEIMRNISLVLANHHFTEGPIRPNVPALIHIGGIQAKEKPDALPEDINKFLDSSSDEGAVYFSFGSNVQMSLLRPELNAIFFKVLSNLKQKVLWKWETDDVPGIASNILYKKWFPQDDVLAHRNVKLFITHGGKGGLAEAQYRGIPMLAFPFFGDQQRNGKLMEREGFGLNLDFSKVTEESFRYAVHEVLYNSTYTDNVKKFSQLYRDRPLSASDEATFWIEYVIRHKGAKHLQSPYVHMNFWQRWNLDVLGLIFAVVYVALKILACCTKFVFRKMCKRKEKKE